MQDIKSTEISQQTEQPRYESPEITVYKEEELLQTVAVLGCTVFAE